MRKDLKLGTSLRSNGGDLTKWQLARESHAAGAQLLAQEHATDVVDVRLRGDMNLSIGQSSVNLSHKAQVLDDKGVGTSRKHVASRLDGTRELSLLHHDVHRHVDTHAMLMGQFAQPGKLVKRDAARSAASIEGARHPAVDGVGAGRDGSKERPAVTRRGK